MVILEISRYTDKYYPSSCYRIFRIYWTESDGSIKCLKELPCFLGPLPRRCSFISSDFAHATYILSYCSTETLDAPQPWVSLHPWIFRRPQRRCLSVLCSGAPPSEPPASGLCPSLLCFNLSKPLCFTHPEELSTDSLHNDY